MAIVVRGPIHPYGTPPHDSTTLVDLFCYVLLKVIKGYLSLVLRFHGFFFYCWMLQGHIDRVNRSDTT